MRDLWVSRTLWENAKREGETAPMQQQHILFQENSIRIGNSTLWLKCFNFMSRGHILKCHFYGKVEGQTLNLYWSKGKGAGSLSKGLSQESSHGETTDQMRAVVSTETMSRSCSLFVGTVSHLTVPLSSGTEWRGMPILGNCNHCWGQRVNGQGRYKSNSKIQRTLPKQVNWVPCNPDSKLEEQSNLIYKTQQNHSCVSGRHYFLGVSHHLWFLQSFHLFTDISEP